MTNIPLAMQLVNIFAFFIVVIEIFYASHHENARDAS
jgi:hypothetical protein